MAVVGDVDVEPLGREAVGDRRREQLFVFDHQDAHPLNCAGRGQATPRCSAAQGASQDAPDARLALGPSEHAMLSARGSIPHRSIHRVVSSLAWCAPRFDPPPRRPAGGRCWSVRAPRPRHDESEHFPMTATFAGLGLPADLVAALAREGITEPFPIQELTIADALAGRDVCGKAKTGSGKTLAFGLPLLGRIGQGRAAPPARRWSSCPTRELANQVTDGAARRSASVRDRKVRAVYGGVVDGPADRRAAARASTSSSARPVASSTSSSAASCRSADGRGARGRRGRPHGRHGLHAAGAEDPLPASSREHQTMLFSATLDGAVKRLVDRYMDDPVSHEVERDRADRRRDGPPLPRSSTRWTR